MCVYVCLRACVYKLCVSIGLTTWIISPRLVMHIDYIIQHHFILYTECSSVKFPYWKLTLKYFKSIHFYKLFEQYTILASCAFA